MVSFSLMVRQCFSTISEDDDEASGSSESEQVKSRLVKAVVFIFNQLASLASQLNADGSCFNLFYDPLGICCVENHHTE